MRMAQMCCALQLGPYVLYCSAHTPPPADVPAGGQVGVHIGGQLEGVPVLPCALMVW